MREVRARFGRARAAFVLLLAVTWWVLSGGGPGSWIVGVPAIAVATAWSVRHAAGPGRLPQPFAFIRFAAYFLRESLRSGIYVAGLAVRPGARPEPHFVLYDLRLPPGPARWTFLNTVSLLPGTLSVAIADEALSVHRISAGPDHDADLHECERRVAGLFGIDAVAEHTGSAPDA